MRTTTLTPVFWNPVGLSLVYPPNYESEIERFLTDVAADSGRATNFYSLLTQYYEGAGSSLSHVEYAVTAGTALHDTGALPTGFEELCTTPFEGTSRPCVTDKGLRNELKSIIKANSLPTGIGHEYIVFFPPGIDSCIEGPTGPACSGANYCGYHGTLNAGTPEEVEYANEPDNGDPQFKGGCTAVTGQTLTDAYQTINTTSHEVSESVTDPEVEEHLSWYDQNKLEIEKEEFEYGEVGDMCAWEFKQGAGALEAGGGAPSFDQMIDGHEYLLQTEWDNAHSTCSISDETASTKAAFTDSATAPVHTGSSISFNADPSHAPVAIKTYEWNWGDGTQPTVGASATATHAYTSTGVLPIKSFTVTLKVTDENGNTDTTTHGVEVEDRPPEASFSAPTSITEGVAAAFDGLASSDPDGAVASYSWDFGDKTTAVEGAAPEHAYSKAGEYKVTLTVTDNAGQHASVSHFVTVAATPPVEEKSGESGKTNSGETTTSKTTTREETTNATSGSTTTNVLLTSRPESSKSSAFATLPSNALQIAVQGNRRKGTITLTIAVASSGVLSLSDQATRKPLLVSLKRSFTSAGQTNLRMALTGAGRSLLRRKHRLIAHALIVFTPTGGTPNKMKVTLHFQLFRGSKR